MVLSRLLLAAGLLAAAAPVAAAQASCGSGTTTTYFSGGTAGAGFMFDIAPTVDMTIECVDVSMTTSSPYLVVWYCPTTAVGNASNPAAWTQVASGTATGVGVQTLDISGNGVVFQAGSTYGIYVDYSGPYSAGQGVMLGSAGTATTFSGTHCSLTTQYKVGPFFGAPTPAEWNGTLRTDAVGPSGPALAVSGSCPGLVSLDASSMTPGGPVVFGYALSAGSFTVAAGPCAGLTLPLAAPTQLGIVVADANGDAGFSGNAPAAACGTVSVVAVDAASCTATNVELL